MSVGSGLVGVSSYDQRKFMNGGRDPRSKATRAATRVSEYDRLVRGRDRMRAAGHVRYAHSCGTGDVLCDRVSTCLGTPSPSNGSEPIVTEASPAFNNSSSALPKLWHRL